MEGDTSTVVTDNPSPAAAPVSVLTQEPLRRRLPDERKAIVHHFSVGGHEGYLMVGLYEDGQPGEIFIRMAKAGSLMDYLFRYMALKFLPPTTPASMGAGAEATAPAPAHLSAGETGKTETDAPACKSCGAIMTSSGTGYRCENCGSTSRDLPKKSTN